MQARVPCFQSVKEDSSYHTQALYQQIMKCFTHVNVLLCNIFQEHQFIRLGDINCSVYSITSLYGFAHMAMAQKAEKPGYRQFFYAYDNHAFFKI